MPSGTQDRVAQGLLERAVQRALHGLRQQVEGERGVAEVAPGRRSLSGGDRPPDQLGAVTAFDEQLLQVDVGKAGRVGQDVPGRERREAGSIELGEPARRAAPSAGSARPGRAACTAVATIGLVIDASRQTALRADPWSLDRRERIQAGDPLGAGNGEDHERDGADLDLAGGDGEGVIEGVLGHPQNDTPAAGTAGAGHASRRHAHDPRAPSPPGSSLPFVAAIALGACSLLPPGAVPEALNPVLVTYEASGGECPQGPCGFRAAIHRDGTVVRSDGMAQRVDDQTLAQLTEQVAGADWDAILASAVRGRVPEELRRPGGDLHVQRRRRNRSSSRRARWPSIRSRTRSGSLGGSCSARAAEGHPSRSPRSAPRARGFLAWRPAPLRLSRAPGRATDRRRPRLAVTARPSVEALPRLGVPVRRGLGTRRTWTRHQAGLACDGESRGSAS